MKASAVRYLIDAGPLVGALSARDQWHQWSASIVATLDEPVFTSEAVLAEAAHLLKIDRSAMLALVRLVAERRLNLIPYWDSHGHRATELLSAYPQMDVADASLVVLSEQFPRARLITVDVRDFTIYRRFRDDPLPLIAPL